VEIKCQLDATEVCLLQILLLAQHVSGTIMSIIRSSRVLYGWLLPVEFGALVFKLPVWCTAVGCVSGLRDAAASRKPAVILTIQNPASTKMPGNDVAGHKNNAVSDLTVNSAMPVML